MSIAFLYRTITLLPGNVMPQYELDSIGKDGFKLVAVVPLFSYEWNGTESIIKNGGTELIFLKKDSV